MADENWRLILHNGIIPLCYWVNATLNIILTIYHSNSVIITTNSNSCNITLYNGKLQENFSGKIPLENYKLPLKNIFWQNGKIPLDQLQNDNKINSLWLINLV